MDLLKFCPKILRSLSQIGIRILNLWLLSSWNIKHLTKIDITQFSFLNLYVCQVFDVNKLTVHKVCAFNSSRNFWCSIKMPMCLKLAHNLSIKFWLVSVWNSFNNNKRGVVNKSLKNSIILEDWEDLTRVKFEMQWFKLATPTHEINLSILFKWFQLCVSLNLLISLAKMIDERRCGCFETAETSALEEHSVASSLPETRLS